MVQIENTEQLPERQDGEKRIRIVKVSLAFSNQSVLNMDFIRFLWAVLFEICKSFAVCFEHASMCQIISLSEAAAAEVLPAYHPYCCTVTVWQVLLQAKLSYAITCHALL